MFKHTIIIVILVILGLLIGVTYYSAPTFIIEKSGDQQKENINQANLDQNDVSNHISECGLSSPNFVCQSVTQGMEMLEPNYYPPIVCGCLPTCSDGEMAVVSQGSGFWPDGSNKGMFVCSSEVPPFRDFSGGDNPQ